MNSLGIEDSKLVHLTNYRGRYSLKVVKLLATILQELVSKSMRYNLKEIEYFRKKS